MLALVATFSLKQHPLLLHTPTILPSNLYKAGMAIFVTGLLILFGQAYSFAFSTAILSIFMPPDVIGYYDNHAVFYFSLNAAAIILIITGVMMFYRGRKERNAMPAEHSLA
jgi:hypothetical protein